MLQPARNRLSQWHRPRSQQLSHCRHGSVLWTNCPSTAPGLGHSSEHLEDRAWGRWGQRSAFRERVPSAWWWGDCMTGGRVVTYGWGSGCRANVGCSGQCGGRGLLICKEMNRGSQLMSLSYRRARGKCLSKDHFLKESFLGASSSFEWRLACF